MVEFFSTGDEPAFSMDAVYSEGRQGGKGESEEDHPRNHGLWMERCSERHCIRGTWLEGQDS
jgi:hypothetical protein